MKSSVGTFEDDNDRRFYEHLQKLLELHYWPLKTGKESWTLSAEITNSLISQKLYHKEDDDEQKA